MNMISTIRKEVAKVGQCVINVANFNKLQEEWIQRTKMEVNYTDNKPTEHGYYYYRTVQGFEHIVLVELFSGIWVANFSGKYNQPLGEVTGQFGDRIPLPSEDE